MTDETVRVVGGARLTATLHAAQREIDTMATAHERAGRLVLTHARSLAPRDTGRLAGSLRANPGEGEVTVGTSVIYAGVHEYGWSAHNIAAHPYLIAPTQDMRPALIPFYDADARVALAGVRGA